MLIEFLVEEESAEAALSTLVPAIIGDKIPFKIRVFQGKKNLLSRLPERLRAYRCYLPSDTYSAPLQVVEFLKTNFIRIK